MDAIGIRELRQHASRYVQAAKEGRPTLISDRGTPVARLEPLSALEQHLSALVARHGLIAPLRARTPFGPRARLSGPPLSPILEEGRADRLA
ncbi:MAG: type II toxin-antitoxin system prevent-host-death family antitoxin [Intrasporangium sp.]|uniref:type II toxin-antitoxin system Phd/YefM family antitoxin n=1 Tax=Intrasporangium sp. TaxID=1925024 RepID=UPI00264719CE|nr:type II toxin-antitoxin system prevent-host-death family antitoxin [Intrasporangium sp.]MDN5794845.1 type II toxin-antitoxin system prevent-host-death family antitoxin [Intrasporangium sp.]